MSDKIPVLVDIQPGGCYTTKDNLTYLCVLKMPFKEQKNNCVMVRLDEEDIRLVNSNGRRYIYTDSDDDFVKLALVEPDLEVIARNQLIVMEHFERKERLKNIQASLKAMNDDIAKQFNPEKEPDTLPQQAVKTKTLWEKIFGA